MYRAYIFKGSDVHFLAVRWPQNAGMPLPRVPLHSSFVEQVSFLKLSHSQSKNPVSAVLNYIYRVPALFVKFIYKFCEFFC